MTASSDIRPVKDLTGAWEEVDHEQVGRPVNYWALVGLSCVVLQAGVFGAWLASGDADRTATGPTPVPDGMQTAASVMVVGGLGLAAVAVGWFVVRPLMVERRLPIDGMFLLALPSVGWQVVLPNYNQLTMTWNSHYANLGSWGPWIPGWLPPEGEQLAVPLLWLLAILGAVIFPGMLAAGTLMRRLRDRDPQIGMLGLLGATYSVFAVVALVAEAIFLRAGVYSYAGGFRWLSLFPDTHHQLPLYQPLLLAGVWTGFAAMRFFRSELGEIIPWRGLDRVRGGGLARGSIRFAAVAGILNLLVFVGWSVPTATFGVYADEFPVDVLERSYLTNGLCGPDTDYHCPGPDIPIPRPDSAHITPSGELARP